MDIKKKSFIGLMNMYAEILAELNGRNPPNYGSDAQSTRDVLSVQIYRQRGTDPGDKELHLFLQQQPLPEAAPLYDTNGISLCLCDIRNSLPAVQQGGNAQPNIILFLLST